MSEAGAQDVYRQILEAVAARAERIGTRPIASHWPFVGTDYRRLLIVGQALAGWDDKATPALWTPAAVESADGRDEVLAATRGWATARREPISEPLRTRSHSSFWSLSKRTVLALEPDGDGPWFSRSAWWNLFPLGWGDTNRSPDGALWMAQVRDVPALFWEVVDMLDPTRIVILAGKGYWDNTASDLGLGDLPRLPWPLIAGGVRDQRSIVWTYHPGARLPGVDRAGFASAIAEATNAMVAEV